MKVHSTELMADVCNAIGLNPNMINRFVITFDINEPMRVDIEGFADVEDVTTAVNTFRKFKAVERKPFHTIMDLVAREND